MESRAIRDCVGDVAASYVCGIIHTPQPRPFCGNLTGAISIGSVARNTHGGFACRPYRTKNGLYDGVPHGRVELVNSEHIVAGFLVELVSRACETIGGGGG